MSFSLMTAAAIAAVTATSTTLAASSWRFDVQSDPLGQNVYVAEATGTEDLPQAFLRFSCGGMPGVLLQLNLGQALQDGGDFRADDPAWEDVTFVFPGGEYAAATKRAAIADGIGTFEIKGSEAMFIARQFKAGGELIVRQSVHSARFMLDEATGPISEVIASCPFKYEDQ